MLIEARTEAGLSQECAANKAHVGRRSLSRYELVPEKASPQVILGLSSVYQNRELIEWYCTDICEIGKQKHCKIKVQDLSTAGLRWFKELKDVQQVKDRLLEILCDGRVDSTELSELTAIMKEIDEFESAIHALKVKVIREMDIMARKNPPAGQSRRAIG